MCLISFHFVSSTMILCYRYALVIPLSGGALCHNPPPFLRSEFISITHQPFIWRLLQSLLIHSFILQPLWFTLIPNLGVILKEETTIQNRVLAPEREFLSTCCRNSNDGALWQRRTWQLMLNTTASQGDHLISSYCV